MWFSTTNTIDYDNVVGDLCTKNMRRRSSQEMSTSKEMVARGRSKERGEDSQSKSRYKLTRKRVYKNVGTTTKQGTSRNIVGK